MTGTKQRLNKMENDIRSIRKEVQQLTEALVSGNLKGSMVDSLNYCVQSIKILDSQTSTLRKELNTSMIRNQQTMEDVYEFAKNHKLRSQLDDHLTKKRLKRMTPSKPRPPKPKSENNKDGKKDSKEKEHDSTDKQIGSKGRSSSTK